MRVLLASDASPSSLRAAGYVARMASRLPGIQVVLVTVVPSPEDHGRGHEILTRTTGYMRPYPPSLETAILTGDPAEAICHYAAKIGAEMIVVGTRGQSLKKLLLGSVSERTIGEAYCPVLVVK
jgi:nucleotide-binding universal stress UspA family protein